MWKGEHILLQLPFTVVEWTYISSLEPARDAMEVERVLQGACTMSDNSLLRPTRDVRCKYPRQQCILHWWQRPDLPGNQCLWPHPIYQPRSRAREEREGRTQIHDMVSADCTVVDDDVCFQSRAGSASIPSAKICVQCLPHAHSATAFHYATRSVL